MNRMNRSTLMLLGAAIGLAPFTPAGAVRKAGHAPNFTAVAPNNSRVHLADYAGKVVVIDFWASWCPYCVTAAPDLNKVAADYKPKGVAFLPVCTWDTRAGFNGWVRKHKEAPMRFLFDPAAKAKRASIATKLYGVNLIPTRYVIGKDGTILAEFTGAPTPGEPGLRAVLDKALGQ